MCTYVAEGDRAARGRCYITQLPDSLRGRPAATGKKRETGRRVARPAHVGQTQARTPCHAALPCSTL